MKQTNALQPANRPHPNPLPMGEGTKGRKRRLTAITMGLLLLGTFAAVVKAQSIPENRGGIAPAAAHGELALTPPRDSKGGTETGKRPDGMSSLVTLGGSLAMVLGLFLLTMWLLRRASPNATAALPMEVFEVLGRAPLAGRQQAHLLRCGNKLLLVSVAAAGSGATTLGEITDPAEVARLADLCRHARPAGPTTSLRRIVGQTEKRDD